MKSTSTTRQNAEDFDPVSAEVWGPSREVRSSGVPGQGAPVLIFGPTRIKTPRGMFTNERTNQQQPDSRSDVTIEIWNFGGCDNLTADMWIMHRGTRYDIVGKNDMQADYRRLTTKYQCRICTNPT